MFFDLCRSKAPLRIDSHFDLQIKIPNIAVSPCKTRSGTDQTLGVERLKSHSHQPTSLTSKPNNNFSTSWDHHPIILRDAAIEEGTWSLFTHNSSPLSLRLLFSQTTSAALVSHLNCRRNRSTCNTLLDSSWHLATSSLLASSSSSAMQLMD